MLGNLTKHPPAEWSRQHYYSVCLTKWSIIIVISAAYQYYESLLRGRYLSTYTSIIDTLTFPSTDIYISMSCFSASISQKNIAKTLWLGKMMLYILSTFNPVVTFTWTPQFSNIWESRHVPEESQLKWHKSMNHANGTENKHFLSLYFQRYFIDTYHALIFIDAIKPTDMQH